MRPLKIQLLTLVALLTFALVPSSASPQTSCHLFTSADPVPEDFGAAYNLFSSARETVLKADCESAQTAELTVGNGRDSFYVYKTGYEWTGVEWRPFPFTGSKQAGDDWYVGTATANLSRSQSQLDGKGFFVALTCLWVGKRWKCGCRNAKCSQSYWQLQGVSYPPNGGATTVRKMCNIPTASGNTYYIAPNGSDSAAGTSASPFRTFTKAIGVLGPGSTLILQDGTYGPPNASNSNQIMYFNNVKGTAAAPIAIRAQNPGKAILDASGFHSGIWLQEVAHLYFAGIEVKNASGVGVRFRHGGNDITLTDMTIHHNAHVRNCSAVPGGFGILMDRPNRNITVSNSIIHSNGRLAAETNCTKSESDAINGWDQGLYLMGRGHRVENNIFHNHQGGFHLKIMGYDGAVAGGPHVVVSNNLFIDPSGRTAGHSVPDKDWRAAISLWENDHNTYNVPIPLIQNNLFYNTEGTTFDTTMLINKTASSFWPENYAYNNITTAGYLIRGGTWPVSLTLGELFGVWMLADNRTDVANFGLNADRTALVSGSPAINAGRNANAPAYDFYCKPRNDGTVDVGPFEY